MIRLLRRSAWVALALLCTTTSLQAQITTPRILSASPNRFTTLEEQLTNRLRATTEDQRNYVTLVVDQCRLQRLDIKLVVAVERYAIRRNPRFPFPFFERALRFEANKRGVALPTLCQFASTKTPARVAP